TFGFRAFVGHFADYRCDWALTDWTHALLLSQGIALSSDRDHRYAIDRPCACRRVKLRRARFLVLAGHNVRNRAAPCIFGVRLSSRRKRVSESLDLAVPPDGFEL